MLIYRLYIIYIYIQIQNIFCIFFLKKKTKPDPGLENITPQKTTTKVVQSVRQQEKKDQRITTEEIEAKADPNPKTIEISNIVLT